MKCNNLHFELVDHKDTWSLVGRTSAIRRLLLFKKQTIQESKEIWVSVQLSSTVRVQDRRETTLIRTTFLLIICLGLNLSFSLLLSTMPWWFSTMSKVSESHDCCGYLPFIFLFLLFQIQIQAFYILGQQKQHYDL